MRIYLTGDSTANPIALLASYLHEGKHNVAIAGHLLGYQQGREDFLKLMYSDAIALLPGWQKSPTANLELQVARHANIRVVFLCSEMEDLALANLIMSLVLLDYGVLYEELTSKCRKQNLSDARWTYASITRQKTTLSLSRIGGLIARDHATTLHGIEKAEELLDTDRDFRNRYLSVKQQVEKYETSFGKAAIPTTEALA